MALRDVSIAVALAAVLASAGCAPKAAQAPAAMGGTFLQENWSSQELPAAKVVRRSYRLREGDSLEIIYHVRGKQGEISRLSLEDVVTIRFPFNPSLNQSEKVRSDGALHLALVGAVPVLDRTVEEVQDDLTRRYCQHIKNPIVTVSFKESKRKIADLTEAIKNAAGSQSRTVTVSPDGSIPLPFISDIRAAGKTLAELRKDLNDGYRGVGLEELEVTVNIQMISPIRVYVLGEVRIPGTLLSRSGAVAMPAEITLLQAIAQAGGYIPRRAELSKVVLIRRRNLPRPQAAIVDLYQLLANRKRRDLLSGPMLADSSRGRYDVWLEDGDIVYVPTTKVAKRADYIDYVWTRSISAMGGFSSSAGNDAK
ncbi:MAG: polysaccharide biosynthesis/export family protein [Phycisphaerae bacterium]|nr:polysaccharide biosynthesis/export family protein [Phycisphaerae bacterium]